MRPNLLIPLAGILVLAAGVGGCLNPVTTITVTVKDFSCDSSYRLDLYSHGLAQSPDLVPEPKSGSWPGYVSVDVPFCANATYTLSGCTSDWHTGDGEYYFLVNEAGQEVDFGYLGAWNYAGLGSVPAIKCGDHLSLAVGSEGRVNWLIL